MNIKAIEQEANQSEVKYSGDKGRLVEQMMFLSLGFLYSISGLGAGFSPFGVSFAGSAPGRCLLSSTVGAVVGYFILLDSVTALRYTATVLAMAVIMLALRPFKDIVNRAVTSVVVVAVCLLVTGIAVVVADGVSVAALLLCMSESIVGGASAYVFSRCKNVFYTQGGLSCLTSKDATCIVVCITLLLLSLGGINIMGIYPAHILAVTMILLCSFYGRESGGAIVGICTGVTLALGEGNMYLVGMYAFGGLLAGVFSRFGRVCSFVAFALSGIAVTMISFGYAHIGHVVVENVISCILFIVLSVRFGSKLEAVLVPTVTSPIIDSVKSDIVSRLRRASLFSAEICGNVTAVNEALDKSESTDCRRILKKTKEQVCGSCGLYDVCWNESGQDIQRSFETLLHMKKKGVYLEYKTVPQSFSGVCIRTENICSNLNKMYSEYKIRQQTENRIREIHSLAAGQFMNVSSLLQSLSEDVEKNVYFDMEIASRFRSAAVSSGLEATECCCAINEMEKMSVELRVRKPYDKTMINTLLPQLDMLTDRSFNLPEIEDYNDCVKLIYKEKPQYRVLSACAQYNSADERFSGDSYTTFSDNNGYFYALLCDGMGTGARAAVSSSLAVNLFEKLIKAGFGINATINTVNTSLISGSGDECSVTLDLIVIDLYTGHCEFYKCGASDTLVKKKGRIVTIGFDSMPLGILPETDIGTGSGTLDSGDIVMMCTDGVREEDYYDLRQGLKVFSEGEVRKFTNEISAVIRKKQPEKNDDMTIMTLVFMKN